MKIRSAVDKLLTVCLFLLLFSARVSSGADFIFVDPEEEAHHKEIIVKKDEVFTLRLKGGGWYLNRYDSVNLLFKLRISEPGYTDFTIFPVGENPAYLFFSYLDRDMYIRVIIEKPEADDEVTVASGEGPAVKEPVVEEPADEGPAVKEPVVEEPANEGPVVKEPRVKNLPVKSPTVESGKEKASVTAAEDPEIYYITKDKEKVKVPSVNEETRYKRGLRYFNNGEYDKASEHFLEYLSGCVSCDHKDDARFKEAEIYLKQDMEDEAFVYLEELIESGSEEYKILAYRIKADMDFKAGRFDNALEGYKQVLSYGNGDVSVLKNTGDIYYQLGDYENALKAYEQGIENGLSVDEVFFRAASICDSPGKYKDLEKAYRYYKVILDIFPDFEHYGEVKKRVSFMEKNFFNYE